jgi:hypothetical protein
MTNSQIEDRLRDHYAATADKLTLSEIAFEDLMLPSPATQRRTTTRRRATLGIAAAVLLITGIGAAFIVRSGPSTQAPATTGSPPPAETTAVTTVVTTIDDRAATKHRIETVPYVLNLPDAAPPQPGSSYVDPPAGGIGRTFLSTDGQLTKVFVVVSFRLDAAQLPGQFGGASIDVPIGSARLNEMPLVGLTIFSWDLPGQRLLVSGLGMTKAETVAAAIEYQERGTVAGLELNSVWGGDRVETDQVYLPATEAPTEAGGDDAIPRAVADLQLTWSPPAIGWPTAGTPGPVRTTVLGLPAWTWRSGADDATSETFVAWQIAGSRRWMQLQAPTVTFDSVLAKLQPTDITSPTVGLGFLAVPSMDGGAFVLNGIVGHRLDEPTTGNALHDASTALPEHNADGGSLVYVSREQFGALESIPLGTEIEWTPTGGDTHIKFVVTSVRSYDVNTDPLATTESGLVVVMDTRNPDSGRQIVITAEESLDQSIASRVSS